MKLASMANYQQDGIIAVEYDTETETGSAYTIIDGVKEELPSGPVQHNAAGHLATEANYGGNLVTAQYDAVSGSGNASAVVAGVDIEIGGDAEEGNGILSITISPSITTTPALDSLFPVYYEDLTDVQKQDGVFLTANNETLQGQYTVTITPTSNWYIADGDTLEYQDRGEPIVMEVDGSEGSLTAFVMLANGTTQETITQYFSATLLIGD